MRTAPSRKNLMETFRIDAATADAIRAAWKTQTRAELRPIIERVHTLHHGHVESTAYSRMLAIDVLGEFQGVEYLGKSRHGVDVDFLNAGDTYAPTLAFIGNRMVCTTVGDLVERGYVKAV